VNLIMAQRLARVICAQCKEDAPVAPRCCATWDGRRAFVPQRGAGCAACGGTSFRGRIALYEVMPMSEELREAVLAGATARAQARRRQGGMKTLRQSGLTKRRKA
jgi:type IV pilus assembly protein PilB